MNWIGGRLSRHSRTGAAGSISARQKQHFVKVQANLRSAHHQASINTLPRTIEPQHSRHNRHLLKVKKEQTPDDDLYDATPPPRDSKRKREPSAIPSESETVANDEGSVSEKRRRLLRKGDWVGMMIQQPPELQFTYPKHGQDVGRRRKITDGHQARYASKQNLIVSPFTRRVRHLSSHVPVTYGRQRVQGRSDVRISIGGKVVPPGISSSSAPSKRRSSTHIPRHSQGASSDVMLLDNDGVGTPSESHNFIREPVEEVSEKHEARNDLSSGCLEEKLDQDEHEMNTSADTRSQIPESDSKRPKHSKRGRTDNDSMAPNPIESPIFEVFSSSSTSIHHPMPRSSKVSILLRSGSSEIAESTVAQVGNIKPVVPSSQVLDNEIWETWMAPLDDGKGHSSTGSFRNPEIEEEGGSISPGVSVAPFVFRGDQPRVSRSSPAASSQDLADSASDLDRSPGRVSSPQAGLTEDIMEEDQLYSQERPGREVERGAIKSTMDTPETVEARASCEFKTPSKKSAKEPDLDEIWRKFVFGSGDHNSVVQELQQSSTTGTGNGNTQASSMLANTSLSNLSGSGGNASNVASDSPQRSAYAFQRTLDLSSVPFRYSKPPTHGTGRLSTRATQGSPASAALDSASASMAPGANSVSFMTSESRPTKKRFIFTKPRSFIGKHSGRVLEEERPLYIGRRRGDPENVETGGNDERDIYSLTSSSDGVEPIEDD
jgi:hypothetical protein